VRAGNARFSWKRTAVYQKVSEELKVNCALYFVDCIGVSKAFSKNIDMCQKAVCYNIHKTFLYIQARDFGAMQNYHVCMAHLIVHFAPSCLYKTYFR